MNNEKIKTPVNRTVTRDKLSEIYGKVCDKWQRRIKEFLAEGFFQDEFEVPEEIVTDIYKEQLNDAQREWLIQATGDGVSYEEWGNGNLLKFTIGRNESELYPNSYRRIYYPIAFKTVEIRDEFLIKHEGLLKEYFQIPNNS